MVDSMFFVGTRVRGGRIATLEYPDHRLSAALGHLLTSAMLAARDAGPCPHLKPNGGWVLVLALGRVMCVNCAWSPELKPSWSKGAPCVLCDFPVATFAAFDFWPDGEELGVTRAVFTLCPDCIRAECGAEVCV